MWLGPGNRLCLMQFTHCEAGCSKIARNPFQSLESMRHRFESAGALWYRFHSVQTRKTYPHVFQKNKCISRFLSLLRNTRNKRYMTAKLGTNWS